LNNQAVDSSSIIHPFLLSDYQFTNNETAIDL